MASRFAGATHHERGIAVKKTIAVILFGIISLAGCAAHNAPVNPPSPTQDWTITATWNEDFTNFVPCSSTVTKGCVSGFTWGYLQGTTQVPLKTSAVTVCTGTTQPETCTDSTNSVLGIGSVTFYCIANYVDNSATTGSTGPVDSSSQTVSLGSPTNLTVTKQ